MTSHTFARQMRFTREQYDEYLARRNSSAKKSASPPDKLDCQNVDNEPYIQNEKDLHERILEYCRVHSWLVFHGSMAHRAMRTLGEPDFLVLCPGGKLFMIECKTRKGKLSTEQLGVMAWAQRLGHTIHLIRTYTGFLDLVNELPENL